MIKKILFNVVRKILQYSFFWVFNQIDKNKDGVISKQEIKDITLWIRTELEGRA